MSPAPGTCANARSARYAHAKLANVLHTKALAARYGGRENNVIVAAVHPGVVETYGTFVGARDGC